MMKMNEYIELYERHKYEGNNTIDSLILTLQSLKQNRESWGQDNKLAKYLGIGLRIDKHPFFQPKVTQKKYTYYRKYNRKIKCFKRKFRLSAGGRNSHNSSRNFRDIRREI